MGRYSTVAAYADNNHKVAPVPYANVAGGAAGGGGGGGGGAAAVGRGAPGGAAGAFGKGAGAGGGSLLPTTVAAGGGGALPSSSSAAAAAARGGGAGGINARAVSLHVYADAFSSLCVVAAALARHLLGWASADTLQAAVVACFTLYIAVPLLRATALLLLQTTPPALRKALDHCRREALTVDGVLEVLDERFWQQSPGFSVGSLTVRVRGDASERDVLERVRRAYGRVLTDLTVQVEKDPKLAWAMAMDGGIGGAGASASGGDASAEGGGGGDAAVSVHR